MTRLMLFMAAHPKTVLAAVLSATLVFASQLPRLSIDVSPQALAVEGDPAREFYQRTVALFGADNISILFVQDPELFAPQRLAAVRDLIGRVEALPFVVRTESLFSLPHLRTEDGYVRTAPYLAQIPDTPAEAQAIRDAALANPFARKHLLSEDGTAMAVNVYLSSGERPPGFDEHVRDRLAEAISPLEGEVARSFVLGLPSIRSAIGDLIRQDQRIIAPAAAVVLLLTLALTLRRLRGTLVPLATASVSVVWTLGAMAALGIPVNVMTAMVPVLLIIVGSSENIHLISEYERERDLGHTRATAMGQMAERMGLAVALTFATTYLGFLSVAANPIALLREFGLVASTALLGNFLVTVSLAPAMLSLLDRGPARLTAPGGVVPFKDLALRVGERVLRQRRAVLLTTLVLTVIALIGMGKLRVDNNLLNYLAPDDPVRQKAGELHRTLAGVDTFTLVLDGRIEGTFHQVRYLRELEKVQRYLDGTGRFDTSLSFADYVGLLNSVANDSGLPELPRTDEELSDLLLFVKPKHVEGLVSGDFSRATIVVRYSLESSAAMNEALRGLDAFVARSVDSGLSVHATGESVLSSQAAEYITRGQVASLGLMLLAILVMIAVLFVDLRVGLVAVTVNAFPVAILFGVMGYADIPLDTGTVLIAAIAVGICVNHTVHFMVRYNAELPRRSDQQAAVRATLRAEARPTLVTSLTMAAGFATLALSSFTPVVYFGLLSAMVMLTAFFTNLLLTPVLLASTRLFSLWDLISLQLRGEIARQCPLFASMKPRQIRRVVRHGRFCRFSPGETVVRIGDPSRDLLVLLRGNVEVMTPEAGGPDRIRTLGRGDVLDIWAVISESPRPSTAIAVTEADLLALDWPRIGRLIRTSPYSTSLLLRNLARLVSAHPPPRAAPEVHAATMPQAPLAGPSDEIPMPAP